MGTGTRRGLVLVAAVAALVLGVEGSAQASTGNQVPRGYASADYGACGYTLLLTWDGHGNDFAAAMITSNVNTGTIQCAGVLERSTNGGATWSQVSSVHVEDFGESVTTYNYWDGAGYLARVHGWARYLSPDTGTWQYTPDVYTATW